MQAPLRRLAGTFLVALAMIAPSALLPPPAAARTEATSAPTVSAEAAIARGRAAADRDDYAEAMRWYRIAADQGSAEAQFEIGVLYDTGQGVAQDAAEAMRWYQRAADQGFAPAHAGQCRRVLRGR